MNSHSLSFRKREAKAGTLKWTPGGPNLWAQGSSWHFSLRARAAASSQPAHIAERTQLFPTARSVTLCQCIEIGSGEKIHTRRTGKSTNVTNQGSPLPPQPVLKHLPVHHCLRDSLVFHLLIVATFFSNPELCSPQGSPNFLVPLKKSSYHSKGIEGNKKVTRNPITWGSYISSYSLHFSYHPGL